MSPDLDAKLERMTAILRELERVAVAFSAGVDSTLILKVAIDTLGPENVIAVTAKSHTLAQDEYLSAVSLASRLGAEHVVIETHEFDDPNYTANPANRCYFCKTHLFSEMQPIVRERGFHHVVTGANVDDADDWRPGHQAAREHGVREPAAEAGLTKRDIRELSARFNLPTFDKPAMPCLASRIPYGDEVTPEKLRMIEQGEAYLRKELGLTECRVRHHGPVARIEVPPQHIERLASPEFRDQITERLREIGYQYVALDLTGFRSGALNEVITLSTDTGA
jgi:uncharacterized protein